MDTILTQDLTPLVASANQIYSNSVVDIIYSCHCLNPESLIDLKREIKDKIKMSNSNSLLAKGLLGASENCKRAVIVPYGLSVSNLILFLFFFKFHRFLLIILLFKDTDFRGQASIN